MVLDPREDPYKIWAHSDDFSFFSNFPPVRWDFLICTQIYSINVEPCRAKIPTLTDSPGHNFHRIFKSSMPKCPCERAFSKVTGHFPGGSTIFDAQDLKAKFGRNNWRRILTKSPCHNFHRSSKCQKCPWNGFFKGQRLFQRPTANGHSPVSSTIFAATTIFFLLEGTFSYMWRRKKLRIWTEVCETEK